MKPFQSPVDRPVRAVVFVVDTGFRRDGEPGSVRRVSTRHSSLRHAHHFVQRPAPNVDGEGSNSASRAPQSVHDTDDSDAGGYAVLFDMDGVVLTGHGTDAVVYERALDDALADYGPAADDGQRSALAGHDYDDAFATAARSLGVDPVGLFAVRESHSASRVVDRIESDNRGLYDDVDALATLADRYDVGLVSNNSHRVVRAVVDYYGLDAFSFVRGRDTGVRGFERRKPDPHYPLEALDALGADRGVYVGDRETDVVAADRAGLDSVFVRRQHNTETTLSVAPTHEVDSLTELPTLTGFE